MAREVISDNMTMRNFAICSVFLVYGIYAYSAVHTIQTLEDNQTITGKKVFASSITVRGIELTSDGIKFPDGTIQVTSAPVSVSGGGPSSAEFDAIYFKIT